MIDENQMTLAMDYIGQNIEGWFVSEKLNGCRSFWDGQQFWTRGGNVIDAPKWFTRDLPNVPLDGEIWAGRDGLYGERSFQTARVAVQNGGPWFSEVSTSGHPIQFAVFDCPGESGTWDKRMEKASKAIRGAQNAKMVSFQKIKTYQCWVNFLLVVRKLGGEGGMFRDPELCHYETGRSETLLRFKFCK